MNLQRPTTINLQNEAVENSKSRKIRVAFQAVSHVATRDARAYSQLAGLLPGQCIHLASMGELSLHDAEGVSVVSTANLTHNPRCEVAVVTMSTPIADFHRGWIREVINAA